MPETALVILAPEAEPLVADWRAKYDSSAQRGVPAHITLLYPFVPTERLENDLRDELRRMFAAQAAFSFRLTRVARFPDVRLACARACRAVRRVDRADRGALSGLPAVPRGP